MRRPHGRRRRGPDHHTADQRRRAPPRPVRAGEAGRGPGRRGPPRSRAGVLRHRDRVPGRRVRPLRRRPAPSGPGGQTARGDPAPAVGGGRGGRRRSSGPDHAAALHPWRADARLRRWDRGHEPGAPGASACSSYPRPTMRVSKRPTSTKMQRTGTTPVGCGFPAADVPLTTFVADDPDRAWAEIGEYLPAGTTATPPGMSIGRTSHRARVPPPWRRSRPSGAAYQIVTPDEAAADRGPGQPSRAPAPRRWPSSEVAWRYLGGGRGRRGPTIGVAGRVGTSDRGLIELSSARTCGLSSVQR